MRLAAIIVASIIGSMPLPPARQAAANTGNTVRLAEGAPRPPAKIEAMSWLVGRWHGEGLGGTVDEAWSEPAGGSMVGHFRLVKDGKPVFYEIMTVLEVEGSLELRLKHVNPDMTGWEEKMNFVTFKLARLEPDSVHFNGLTFRRAGRDRVEIYLALRNRDDGSVREEKFTMARSGG
jgi:hypothetical protein